MRKNGLLIKANITFSGNKNKLEKGIRLTSKGKS